MRKFIREYSGYVAWIRGVKSRKRLGCEPCMENGLFCPCMQIQGSLPAYMWRNGLAVLKPHTHKYSSCNMGYVAQNCPEFLTMIAQRPRHKRPAIVTINDTAETDKDRERMRKQMAVFFEKVLPEKAWFEN
jgi:hypothetical protein